MFLLVLRKITMRLFHRIDRQLTRSCLEHGRHHASDTRIPLGLRHL